MPTTADVIERYIQTRDFIAKKTAEFEEYLAPYQGSMATMEAWMAEQLNALGVEGEKCAIRTEKGTAFRQTNTNVKVEDRELFMDFVFDGRREGFLTSAVSKDAVKEYLEMHNHVPPPGVAVAFHHKTMFRKPT